MLWVAIKALERLCSPTKPLRVVVYCADNDAAGADILAKAKVRAVTDACVRIARQCDLYFIVCAWPVLSPAAVCVLVGVRWLM